MNSKTAKAIAIIASTALALSLGTATAGAAGMTPSPTPVAPTESAVDSSASPAPDAARPAPEEAAPTLIASNGVEASPAPEPTRSAVVAAPSEPDAAASQSSSGLASVSIQLPSGYALSDLHASKDPLPADPAREPHASLSIVDPVNVANNKTGASLEAIKTRGNFTWTLEKKAYQIKFDASTTVLGMPKAKTWILLANHADPSLLRNKVALDFALDLNVPGTPESRFVDLTIGDEYLGNYLLTEKVEVKTNRLELKDPAGLLLELDNLYGAAEDHYFTTRTSGSTFVLKDAVGDTAKPLGGTVAQSYAEVQADIAELESQLYAVDPDWSAISSMIDVESFIRYYFVQELASNADVSQSSVYLWRDGPDDVLHAGPAWDFDVALGNYAIDGLGADYLQDYVKNARFLRASGGNDWYTQLFRNSEFVDAVNDLFEAELRTKLERVPQKIDELSDVLAQSASANFARWTHVLASDSVFASGRVVGATWAEEVAQLRAWSVGRVAHLSTAYGADMPILQYRSHVSAIGWQPLLTSGLIAGTAGRGLQLEAFDIAMVGHTLQGELQSRAHVQGLGWSEWQSGDTRIGTTERGLQLEAVQFRLTGELAQRFDVSYRVHAQALGWMGWTRNGSVAGTSGRGLQLEAAQIRLLRKTGSTSAPDATLSYAAHVAAVGWMPQVNAPDIAGTTGRGLAMQALTASVLSDQHSGEIEYRAHVQGRGWMEWTTSADYIGTTGLGLRLEAVEARLTGDLVRHYDLRYRAHVQGLGWQGWLGAGQTAGTTGLGLQMEAIQIDVIPRSQ